MMAEDAIITLDDVTVAYQRRPVLHHVSGCFRRGSMTAIVGPNGAGKSTLLRVMTGAIAPSGGRVLHAAGNAHGYAYLPQAQTFNRRFPLSVADVVLMGAWHHLGVLRGVRRKLAAQAREALATVGLEGMEKQRIHALSAGQFQRVLFARLLLQDADVIILDEPFNAVDAQTTQELVGIIRAWHTGGRTVIVVWHDLQQVQAHFPETLLLAREVIAWGATSTVLNTQNLLRAQGLATDYSPGRAVCTV